jgi:uncharacterized protein (DUF1919 family)
VKLLQRSASIANLTTVRNIYFDRKRRLGDWLLSGLRRRKLESSDFTVICNNCLVGTGIYQKFGLKYNTPTVGLLFYPEDYLGFLEGFNEFIKQPMRFKQSSRYDAVNEIRKSIPYPIGVLGDSIEIQFLHYRTEDDAAKKWARRSQRINFDRLYFMFSDRDGVTPEHIERYARLPFERKVFLSSKPTSHPGMTVVVEDYRNDGQVGESTADRVYEKYFDVTGWLNGGDCHKVA